MWSSEDTFVEAVLRGDAVLDDIDDFVEAWHISPDDRELAEHLGFTKQEYALWVEQPDVLPFLIHSKRFNMPTEGVFNLREAHLLAARSAQQDEVDVLLKWLKTRGTI